jgi:hypothetical protein
VPFSRRRQVFEAAHSSLNTINLAVVDDNEPFVRTVLCRTVATTLSMGFVVRKAAGEWHEPICSFCAGKHARGDLGCDNLTNLRTLRKSLRARR